MKRRMSTDEKLYRVLQNNYEIFPFTRMKVDLIARDYCAILFGWICLIDDILA